MNPPPSTDPSNGTAVPAAAAEYSQFSDTYEPVVPVEPAGDVTAYPITSASSDDPAVPASTGAVPSTATSPVTAGPHVPAVLRASAGTADAHVLPLDGSPMMSAEYVLNCAAVIASHVAGVATVTVYPSATAALASADDEPSVTLVDKISTDPDAARAGATSNDSYRRQEDVRFDPIGQTMNHPSVAQSHEATGLYPDRLALTTRNSSAAFHVYVLATSRSIRAVHCLLPCARVLAPARALH